MPENILFTVIGFVFAFILFLILWWIFFRPRGSGRYVKIYSSIEQLRSVGELVAFKMVTKEIVTASQHWFGEAGKRYFQWLVSTKKMAMIFEFDIDFRYDLRSPDFKIEQKNENQYQTQKSWPFFWWKPTIENISYRLHQTNAETQ